jgi:hypothetical protein
MDMPSLAHQQILAAAQGLLFVLFLIPNPAESVQGNWVDQIAQRVRAEYNPASRKPVSSGYERYLTQLHSVEQALVRGNVSAVQAEMNRLVRMVATKEGGLSDSSAQSVLFYISEVTPVEYLDETTKSHLRLIQDMVMFRPEAIEDVPGDSPYGSTVASQTAPWGSWQFVGNRIGLFSPVISLGAGVLVLVAIGAIVFVFVGVGSASTNGPSVIQTNDRPVERVEKKTPSTGSSGSGI